jgi:hypothetical protein
MDQGTVEYKRGPGRPAKPGGMDTWKIYLSMEVSYFFRSLLTDPNTNRIPQGEMSGLVERLLREEMARVKLQLAKNKEVQQ